MIFSPFFYLYIIYLFFVNEYIHTQSRFWWLEKKKKKERNVKFSWDLTTKDLDYSWSKIGIKLNTQWFHTQYLSSGAIETS